MKRILTTGFIVLSVFLGGCSWLNKPYLYGNKSCGTGKTAYVYTNGKAAICLSEQSVAYMICARALGVISENESSSLSGTATASISGVTPEVSAAFHDSLQILYAQEGRLAEARAQAIETCVEIFNNYL